MVVRQSPGQWGVPTTAPAAEGTTAGAAKKGAPGFTAVFVIAGMLAGCVCGDAAAEIGAGRFIRWNMFNNVWQTDNPQSV